MVKTSGKKFFMLSADLSFILFFSISVAFQVERRFRRIFCLTFLLNNDEKLCVVKISSPVNVGGGAGTGICCVQR